MNEGTTDQDGETGDVVTRRTLIAAATAIGGIGGTYAAVSHYAGDRGDGRSDPENSSSPDTPEGTDRREGLFVSEDGSDRDGDGSYARPWATVSRGIKEINELSDPDGTALHVLGGRYDESGDSPIDLTVSASESDPFKLVGHDNPVVNLSGISLPDTFTAAFRLRGTQNVTVEGLTFEESGGYAFRVRDDEITNTRVRDCAARNNKNTGFYSTPGESDERAVVYERCESYGNHHGEGEIEHADGFSLGNGSSYQSVVFVNCIAHNNADDGFDLHFANGNVCTGCHSYRNGFNERGEPVGQSDPPSGWGFKLGTDSKDRVHGPVFLYDCVAWGNRGWQFADNGTPYPAEIYNCTAYNRFDDTLDNPSFQLWGSGRHELRNCLSTNPRGGHIGKDAMHDDQYNSWNEDIDIQNPEYRSENPDHDRFLHLAAESPCIDAGTDVGREYIGSAPDLGAYEYGLDTGSLR